MTKSKSKGGLGRGLDALIPNMGELIAESVSRETEQQGDAGHLDQVVAIGVDLIDPNPYQPRRHFDPESLAELAASIRQQGVFTPLLAIQNGDRYTLISGERRLRASKLAGLREVPVIVKVLDERTMAELALLENLQREDLNAYEEALAYQTLMDHYDLNPGQLSMALGKSRPHIANTVRLLQLSEAVLSLLEEGSLSAGLARPLLRIEDPDMQLQIAEEAIANGKSVRAVEHMIADILAPYPDERSADNAKKAENLYTPIGQQLSEKLQTKVSINGSGKKSQLRIDFYGEDDLKRILDMLGLELY